MVKNRTIKEIALDELHDLKVDSLYLKHCLSDLDILIARTNEKSDEDKATKIEMAFLIQDYDKYSQMLQGNTIVEMALREFIRNRYPNEII